jgi:hypothetical protein
MKKRPIADPTSWRYQAAIHDYVRQFDPLATPGDVLPSRGAAEFWAQCQHFSWFFLSWHRMYLFYFEQIVSATIKQLKGPEWALPYWNYSDSNNPTRDASRRRFAPSSRRIKRPIPCSCAQRNPGCNSGLVIADEFDIDITSVSASRVRRTRDGRVVQDLEDRKPVSITVAAMPSARLK